MDISLGKIEQTYSNKDIIYFYSFIQLKNENFICGGGNNIVNYNDTSKAFSLIQIEETKKQIISLVNIDDHTFATGSDEIKIWKY